MHACTLAGLQCTFARAPTAGIHRAPWPLCATSAHPRARLDADWRPHWAWPWLQRTGTHAHGTPPLCTCPLYAHTDANLCKHWPRHRLQYTDKPMADKAAQHFNGFEIAGRKMTVQVAPVYAMAAMPPVAAPTTGAQAHLLEASLYVRCLIRRTSSRKELLGRLSHRCPEADILLDRSRGASLACRAIKMRGYIGEYR